MQLVGIHVDQPRLPATSGQAAASAAVWPPADLERRLGSALDFAIAAVSDFGVTGYSDPVRPALGFGPEKVVAEAAMLAYVAHDASASSAVRERVEALADLLEPLVRSTTVLATMALDPEQVFRRAVPHVLLTAMGHTDDDFDSLALDLCSRVLDHAVDQPPTVLAERRWIMGVWGHAMPAGPRPIRGTVLSHPFDLLVGSREDPYGLTHLLFYVTDFGRQPHPPLERPVDALLADVDALVVRYLDHGDYDLVGELLMAWPQLHRDWSPTATFAFRVLAHVEDVVGVLPCGNVDPERLAGLAGSERTRYARAASYHTALVMGFLCAVALRGTVPPTSIVTPAYAEDAGRPLRARLGDHPGDWLPVFDAATEDEQRGLTPVLCDLAVARALRERDVVSLRDLLVTSEQLALPRGALMAAAADLLHNLGAAMDVATRYGAQDRSTRMASPAAGVARTRSTL